MMGGLSPAFSRRSRDLEDCKQLELISNIVSACVKAGPERLGNVFDDYSHVLENLVFCGDELPAVAMSLECTTVLFEGIARIPDPSLRLIRCLFTRNLDFDIVFLLERGLLDALEARMVPELSDIVFSIARDIAARSSCMRDGVLAKVTLGVCERVIAAGNDDRVIANLLFAYTKWPLDREVLCKVLELALQIMDNNETENGKVLDPEVVHCCWCVMHNALTIDSKLGDWMLENNVDRKLEIALAHKARQEGCITQDTSLYTIMTVISDMTKLRMPRIELTTLLSFLGTIDGETREDEMLTYELICRITKEFFRRESKPEDLVRICMGKRLFDRLFLLFENGSFRLRIAIVELWLAMADGPTMSEVFERPCMEEAMVLLESASPEVLRPILKLTDLYIIHAGRVGVDIRARFSVGVKDVLAELIGSPTTELHLRALLNVIMSYVHRGF